jgi:hypothetical protein
MICELMLRNQRDAFSHGTHVEYHEQHFPLGDEKPGLVRPT